MVILWKGCKPDNFEPHCSRKHGLTNIWDLRSNFFLTWIFPWIKLSWHSCSVWDKLGWLTWLGISLWRVTYMHGLAVYVKEGLPFAQDLPPEKSADSYLCFWLALFHSVSCFFFLYWSPSLSLYTVFDSFLSNIDEVL